MGELKHDRPIRETTFMPATESEAANDMILFFSKRHLLLTPKFMNL